MSPTQRLPAWHLLLALLVVAIWGSNFVVIKLALAHLPPLLFGTLRFACALLPAVFFLRRPAVPWTQLAAYGVLIGAGQFGLLYLAMDGHISPGLASLVVQTQVFFTIGLAMRFAGERPRGFQWLALGLAAAGIVIIGLHTDGHTTWRGLAMVLCAALCWAGGNTIAARARGVNMLAYVVWASLFSLLPLGALSLAVEGWDAMRAGVLQADASVWAAVLWQAWGNTLFGYAVWAWLLARHPAATVSPMALLVPVFGMGTAALVLAEPLPGWKLQAAALVLGGLALNLLGARWRAARRA
jgi:O-acetylserine/cysteine efflux transporter